GSGITLEAGAPRVCEPFPRYGEEIPPTADRDVRQGARRQGAARRGVRAVRVRQPAGGEGNSAAVYVLRQMRSLPFSPGSKNRGGQNPSTRDDDPRGVPSAPVLRI